MSTKNENVVDDWECIDDSELNTKVNQIKKNATNSQTISNAEIECSRPFSAMILNDDDFMRTQYVPPEPTVKILKRPTNDKSQSLTEQKPKAPIKTLQQREQEYAEARLRILGSAKSEEDEAENVANQSNSVGNPSRYVRNHQPQQYQSYHQQQQNAFQLPPEMRRIEDNVIRLPRGPDGSTGFMFKR